MSGEPKCTTCGKRPIYPKTNNGLCIQCDPAIETEDLDRDLRDAVVSALNAELEDDPFFEPLNGGGA